MNKPFFVSHCWLNKLRGLLAQLVGSKQSGAVRRLFLRSFAVRPLLKQTACTETVCTLNWVRHLPLIHWKRIEKPREQRQEKSNRTSRLFGNLECSVDCPVFKQAIILFGPFCLCLFIRTSACSDWLSSHGRHDLC